MKIQFSLILILLTIMILQSDAVSSPSSSQKDQNLIESTCRRTPDYNLCISIIREDPGAAAADVAGLGLIVVAAVKKKTQETLATISSLSKSAPNILPELRRCKEVYEAVLKGDIPVAEQALVRGDPKFAETAMADAGIEAAMCERAFDGGPPSPLSVQNKYVADVADVARAIIRNLL